MFKNLFRKKIIKDEVRKSIRLRHDVKCGKITIPVGTIGEEVKTKKGLHLEFEINDEIVKPDMIFIDNSGDYIFEVVYDYWD